MFSYFTHAFNNVVGTHKRSKDPVSGLAILLFTTTVGVNFFVFVGR